MASIEWVYARASLSQYFVVTTGPELLLFAFNVMSAADRILRNATSITAKEQFAREVERLIQKCPEFQAEQYLAELGEIPDAIIPHVQDLLRLCREE